MKRYLSIAALVAAIALAGCANPDKSRDDAADTLKVDHNSPEVIQFNNHFPNVETKCDGHGHRLFVTTHDSAVGRNVLVVPDKGCPGYVEDDSEDANRSSWG